MHRYELDLEAIFAELKTLLVARGYCTIEDGDTEAWIFESRWSRGAAYGEIGSTLYSLLASRLREIE